MRRIGGRGVFLWIQAALLLCVPLFFLYRLISELLPSGMTGCILHDRLFLYCPLCGGTRAAEALLRLDVLEALRCNAFVVLVFFLFLFGEAVAWLRYLSHREPILRIPAWSWVVLAVLLLTFWILRNYLMIAHGIDPTGDLGRLWQALLD